MDLLGSIMSSMDKPPSKSDKEKELIKKQREQLEKQKKIEAEKLNQFRKNIEEKISNFLKDEKAKEYTFAPMDKVCRSIVHDVCEVASILAYSFGEEGVDRHIVIFKKEYAPTEDHMNALRRGEEWNEEIEKKLHQQRELESKEKEEDLKRASQKRKFVPNSNYKDKYEHIIGKEAALEAARKTEANSSYGCVPSENKKDQRSIEQTLADIREKKRKLQAEKEKSESDSLQ